MRGIYLASYKAHHPNFDIVYQDINGKRDIGGDMMEVDLTSYDFIIATPPCNWWSRANYRRNSSEYALKTKHLLIDIIDKLSKQNKPFIIENVKNNKQFSIHHLFDYPLYIYIVGRHTYWTNIKFNCEDIVQLPNYVTQVARTKRQGGEEVHEVIERWLEEIHKEK